MLTNVSTMSINEFLVTLFLIFSCLGAIGFIIVAVHMIMDIRNDKKSKQNKYESD